MCALLQHMHTGVSRSNYLLLGWLCGECNRTCSENRKSGIGVLTTKCRCSGNAMYRYLVPLVGKY